MKTICSVITLFIALVSFSSCGYNIGVSKPIEMEGVNSVFIAIPDNKTQYPRLEVELANHLMDNLVQDGRYKVSTIDKADAKLVCVIETVEYNQVRVSRTDGLRPEELSMKIQVRWEIQSLNDNSGVLMNSSETATTRFFIDDSLTTARQNAFPDVLARVSRSIVSAFSNSF